MAVRGQMPRHNKSERQGVGMERRTSLSRQRGAGVVGTIVLALVLGAILVGGLVWWSSRPAPGVPAADAPAAAGQAPAEPQPAAPAVPVAEAADRAAAAMQDKRMFVPPGDNAFELYLQVVDANPNAQQARNALTDLFPYALLYVEQRIAAGDVAEGERVLALMQRSDPNAPALPRIAAQLAEMRTQQAQAQADAERRATDAAARAASASAAARPAATTPPAPAPQVAAPATPAAAPPVAATTPPPAQAEVPPEPAPAAAPAAAQPAPTAAAPAPTTRAIGLPAVVSSAQPRYPVVAQRRKIEGRVELQFTVRTDGSVGNVRVLSSQPRGVFDREAVAAMERWRYAPSTTESTGQRAFDFKLD